MENKLLERLNELSTKLNNYTSPYDKQIILRQYPDLKPILAYIYDKKINFHITGENVLERYENETFYLDHEEKDLIHLLSLLSNRVVTGNAALDACVSYIESNKKYLDIIIKVLNRDLRCGISSKTINKVFPGLVSEFNVPLARDWDPKKHNIFTGEWFLSRKLDGIRCLCFIEGKEITFFSRSGKEFFTLDKIKEDILANWKGASNVILDGEVCIVDSFGQESFKDIMSLIRRKDFTIQNPKLYVFDAYTMEEFYGEDSDRPFLRTMEGIKPYISKLVTCEFLPMIPIIDTIPEIPNGWEGFIARSNNPTQFKRSNNLLKIKDFKEGDYKVQGIEGGKIRIDGVETTCCSALYIQHKGFQVKVGSGLSHKQRVDWYHNPEKIIGKTITVKYFEESCNKYGDLSLRMPILKEVKSYASSE